MNARTNRKKRLRRHKREQRRLREQLCKDRSACCRCDCPATYVAPIPFCDDHWAKWWTQGMLYTKNRKDYRGILTGVKQVQ